MEISKKDLNTLDYFFDEKKKNNEYEIEARFVQSDKLDHDKLQYIFNKLTFGEENGGLNFKKYKLETQLDIIFKDSDSKNNKSSVRLRLLDEDVKKYWLFDDLNNIKIDAVVKTKLNHIDINKYLIRFSLSNEETIENFDLNKYNNKNIKKYFRLKNRYSIYTNDDEFRIDISTTKSIGGYSFKESNIFDTTNEYELEIEYIGQNKNNSLSSNLLKYTWLILSLLDNSINILSIDDKEDILNGYRNLVAVKEYHKNFNSKTNLYFVAANPVTLHVANMISSINKQNILNKYAVTLKADGERNLLYVHRSKNFKLNGNLYLINNLFDILSVGYKDINMVGTLIEGEYIKEHNIFLAYDILFYKGIDVRLNQLNIILSKKMNTMGRLDYLNDFIKEQTITYNENYDIKNIIQIELKKYLYSKSSDGKDIFSLFATLWSTRQNNNFNSDGVIFTPILEKYPLRGGTWRPLFKWKPPELNSIDFLIKIKKNENNDDIILPYYLKDVDNKVNRIKHYKIIELFVGKTVEFSKQNKIKKSLMCTPFNPLKVDEEEIHKYNIVNVFLDDNNKLMSLDPLTNGVNELFDDTVVEFNYDIDAHDFFKWKPIRVRYDKTRSYRTTKSNCGNHENTANDIYQSIINPVTTENLSSGTIPKILDNIIEPGNNADDRYFIDKTQVKTERLSYQNFHNLYIKDYLYSVVAPSILLGGKEIVGKILDLGVGKGYEINRWIKYKFAEAVGIDCDHEAIEIAKNNFKSVPRPKPKTYFIRGDASKLIFPNQGCAYTEANKLRLKQYIPIKYYFDVVSIQFALHYFFKNEITLRTILQNINDNLKNNGYFIGTCFSGERVFEALKNKKEIKGVTGTDDIIWKITKLYKGTKFEQNKSNLGKEIEVFIKSIGIKHVEYLVNFTYLDEIMVEYGFEKVLVHSFEEEYNNMKNKQNKNINNITISDVEKEFSFYNNLFIYKKVSNSSQNLYTKLIKLISKDETIKYKNKLKTVGANVNVDIVSQETEDLIENIESSNQTSSNSNLDYQINSDVNL